MFDPKVWRVWAYRASCNQDAAGGGQLDLEITPGEGNMMIPLYGTIGTDDYAAGRTVRSKITDSTDRLIASLFLAAAVDNVTLPLFFMTENAVAGSDVNIKGSDNWVVAGTDKLIILAQSLIQNEKLSVILRALVYGIKPTVDWTNSGGTPVVTTTYDKFL